MADQGYLASLREVVLIEGTPGDYVPFSDGEIFGSRSSDLAGPIGVPVDELSRGAVLRGSSDDRKDFAIYRVDISERD
jgi:hypothetical protein